MKVVLVEVWSHGGTARYASDLATALGATASTSKGAQAPEVHLIVPLRYPFAPHGCTVHRVLPEPTPARRGGKVGGMVGMVRRQLAQTKAVVKMVRQIKPDVVHILGTTAVSRGLLRFMKQHRKPLWLTVHDIPELKRSPTHWFFALASRHFVRADHIVVHGEWSRTRLRNRYGNDIADRTTVMPLGTGTYGVATDSRRALRAKFGLPDDALVLLLFGGIRRDKGLETVLEALAQCPGLTCQDVTEDSGRALYVWVVGERPAKSEPAISWYQELAQQHGIERQITWLNRYVGDAEVPDVFTASDVALIPYKKFFAGQSAVLSVAAAFHVPVIASDVGDIGNTVRKYGLGITVPAEDAHALAQALSEVRKPDFEWPPSRFDDFMNDTSWQAIGQNLWTLYAAYLSGEGETQHAGA